VTCGANTAINPPTTTINASMDSIAASAFGIFLRISRTGGHRIVASRRPNRIGSRMLHSWPITQNNATSPTPITSNRTVHLDSSTMLCCRRCPALDGPVMISPFLPDG
jgi:hypothetical protein